MLVWQSTYLQTLDDALERGAEAGPAVVVVEGDVGTGKTSLLDELTDRAKGFHVLAAEGNETDRKAFDALAHWGVDGATSPGGAASSAAQALNARLDELSATRPILLRLDDLQWADPESVDALTWLLTRSAGDRLVVGVGTRPLPPHLHPDWQRWSAVRGRTARITLSGLDLVETTQFARAHHPSLGDVSIRQLWEHTSGNPLYLSALLDEYDAADLMQMRTLPAPAEFAVLLGQRMARLPEPSQALLQASAVLGHGWKPLVDVTSLAEVEDGDLAVEAAVGDQLLETRDLGMGVAVRIPQKLIRATIYQQTPLHVRHALHARAAQIVDQTAERFEHQIGAVGRYDDELAAELESWAKLLHDERTHRDAARYLRSASGLSSDPRERHRRWLDSLYETILGQDLEIARLEIDEIEQAEDYVRRDLLLGALATFEQDNHEAVYWLKKEVGEDEDQSPDDPAMHYRIEVLLAWARVQGAGTTEEITRGLDRAARLEPKDIALGSWELFARGLVALRTTPAQEILAQFTDMPQNPVAVPWQLRFQLAWRGTVRAINGLQHGAITDLENIVTRHEEGGMEAGMPHLHALLGFAHWFNGDWNHARLSLGLAVDLGGNYLPPLAAATRPLIAIGKGDLREADELIRSADAMLSAEPWVEAVDLLDIVRVLRVHAGELPHVGTTAPFDRMRGSLRSVQAGSVVKSPVWLAHTGLAALWSHELGDAEACAELLMTTSPTDAKWSESLAQWLFGLTAEARGKGQQALTHLRAAVEDPRNDLPFYRAHILVDHARIAHVLGDPASAEDSLAKASEIYTQLGAPAYVDRIDLARQASGRIAPGRTPVVMLTEREQDVLTLIASGMSYAQISRDLFVTQSTVGYHLSNIYRKAGVSSRHELTEMVRSDPLGFGIATA